MAKSKKPNKSLSALGEWEIIRTFAQGFPKKGPALVCGIGDDAAVLKIGGKRLLVTTDLLQEGVHFDPSYMSWADIGYKALQVNLSDIAAMGGRSAYYWLALSLPKNFSLAALQQLRAGLAQAARQAQVICAGGDTTASKGPVTLAITVLGHAGRHVAYRSGAKRGDDIYVTGPLGESVLGFHLLKRGIRKDHSTRRYMKSHCRPKPPLDFAYAAAHRGLIHAMIDLSDGLGGDLRHLVTASQVRAVLDVATLTPSPVFSKLCARLKLKPATLIFSGGEDYELLFTASPKNQTKLNALAKRHRITLTKIGTITPGRGLSPDIVHGYEHFRDV